MSTTGYDYHMVIWQSFFAICMFFSTLVSYMLPIVIYVRKNQSRSSPTNGLQQDLHHVHHWNADVNQSISDQQQKHRWKRWLSYCNCISAGVFLGVCFLNLIPCVEDEFDGLIKDFPSIKTIFGTFPLAQFTVISGLFLVLFLEEFLASCFKQKSGHSHEVPVFYLDEESTELRQENHHHDNLEQELLLNTDQTSNESLNETPPTSSNVHRITSQNSSAFNDHHGHNHHHHHVDIGSNESMFSFFILMFATSVHSLFEGMALGLQANLSTAIHLFIGIILHECLVAIALGLNAIRLQQDNIKMKTHIKFAIVFSLNIPLGNILGVLLGYTPGHFGRFISAIFQGFAAGTFIHVTFFELIPEEFLMETNGNHHQHVDNPAKPSSRGNGGGANQELGGHDQSNEQNDNDNQQDVKFCKNLKLLKISLLLLGFIIIALVPFIISE